ncbi:MAG: polysulfide reductase NrfD [Verrucomicrobia bacterium]|nr:polysulfide reductase NrfD [Verrucomicrobiota bacterium]
MIALLMAHKEASAELLQHVQGFIYPNELNLLWSVLIVLYPYLTGLVAGAFIMASLERVFNVKSLKPIYRLSMLTSLAFLLVAPLPLLGHLGHPERCYEVMMTPHATSPMAIFGFVYAWYLMAVLLLELWFDYRKDFVEWSQTAAGWKRPLYSLLTLGVRDVSEKALRLDDKMGRIITIIGIPSAFLLHGYVGFIFGSVKANPWWGTVLMPIIFIFSAMVSGIALLMFLYLVTCWLRKVTVDMTCLETIGKCLLTALVVDFSVEALDWIHRLYVADESLDVLVLLASGKLYYSLFLVQMFLGMLVPALCLAAMIVYKEGWKRRQTAYFVCSLLVLIGILAMRWNVVIGGQLFSKSLRGFTTYKLELVGQEGLLMAILLVLLPFVIVSVMIWLFLPRAEMTGTTRAIDD